MRGEVGNESVLGEVGEIDPEVLSAHGIDPAERRVGWLMFDLGLALAAPKRPSSVAPVSRYPSADVDLAFLAPEDRSRSGAPRDPSQEWRTSVGEDLAL